MVAKTKVASIKQISICRLELLGALLLARLFAVVFKVLPDYSISFRAWTDSSVVLSWLAAHPRKWKIFVGNRTTEILDIVPYEQWSHVSSKDNPADLASRGGNPEDLANSTLWWHGPSFLCMNKNHWPQQNQTELSIDEKALSELKPKSPFNAITVITNYTDIELIDNGEFVAAKSSITSLCPFLDEKGILRVRGRLQNSQGSFNA
ncbi:integrase catalytic domain-containing protein [Nephila pilipes]|uniref:Integrase catalytic domain-containing protein n=1 Tax=Nephila pilipes TaxID=299642 RepID=A0A8X6QUE4_NEPPI|nr:integrase catalytic domain-containing protein [Nephila pilipes]